MTILYLHDSSVRNAWPRLPPPGSFQKGWRTVCYHHSHWNVDRDHSSYSLTHLREARLRTARLDEPEKTLPTPKLIFCPLLSSSKALRPQRNRGERLKGKCFAAS